jgi:hypothetical protein
MNSLLRPVPNVTVQTNEDQTTLEPSLVLLIVLGFQFYFVPPG